eukprot:15433793-Alexandrium_andersonii.AAC.1
MLPPTQCTPTATNAKLSYCAVGIASGHKRAGMSIASTRGMPGRAMLRKLLVNISNDRMRWPS